MGNSGTGDENPNSEEKHRRRLHLPGMGRRARVVLPGCAHHVTQRGNQQQAVFCGDADRELYLTLLRDYAGKHGLCLLGYCLMPNHVHLVIVPEHPDSLAKGLGRLHNDYSRWFQIKARRSGHLWQNRFFSCPLSEKHLSETLRYVEMNPVRAQLVSSAELWPWSSAQAHVSGRDQHHLISSNDLGIRRGEDWRRVLTQGWTAAAFEKRLREATLVGRPLGDEQFVNDAEQQLGRTLRPLRRGRKAAVRASAVA